MQATTSVVVLTPFRANNPPILPEKEKDGGVVDSFSPSVKTAHDLGGVVGHGLIHAALKSEVTERINPFPTEE